MNRVLIQGIDPFVARLLIAILTEREHQDEIFGPFAGFDDDPPHVQIAVLQKKLSDYAVAIAQQDAYFGHLKSRHAQHELLELAAVCLALLETHAWREEDLLR